MINIEEEEQDFYIAQFNLNEEQQIKFDIILEKLLKVYQNIDVCITNNRIYNKFSISMIKMILLIKSHLSKPVSSVLKLQMIFQQ